jgi:hypothetical protein
MLGPEVVAISATAVAIVLLFIRYRDAIMYRRSSDLRFVVCRRTAARLDNLRQILSSSTWFEHGTPRVAALAGCASESSSYPPRQRWVADAGAYNLPPLPAAASESSSYPPRQRWVADAGAYNRAPHTFLVRLAPASRTGRSTRRAHVGCNITDPPLTRWVWYAKRLYRL